MMLKRTTGVYETIGSINYFIPYPLPPHDPLFAMDEEITHLHEQAMKQLEQLHEVTQRLPDEKRFIKAYVIKEALLSSAIEGIHTTILDVFTQPLTGVHSKETQLVVNYTKALETACAMVMQDNLAVASRVILKAHQQLMYIEGDENKANPGHYRQQAVRVGNLIPTYAAKIPDLMAQLAQFINKDASLPPLIAAGLAHVQFETIHPFLDGNGRVGRLLIVLMFIKSNLLSAPIIYPSYYFKKHRYEYYVYLDRVRTHGDFEGWIKYYLTAIEQSCADAYKRIKEIEKLEQQMIHCISSNKLFDEIKKIAQHALSILFEFPVITVAQLSEHIDKDHDVARDIIKKFIEVGIVVIGDAEQQRGECYIFEKYVRVLEDEY